jgi:hypothetical protein
MIGVLLHIFFLLGNVHGILHTSALILRVHFLLGMNLRPPPDVYHRLMVKPKMQIYLLYIVVRLHSDFLHFQHLCQFLGAHKRTSLTKTLLRLDFRGRSCDDCELAVIYESTLVYVAEYIEAGVRRTSAIESLLGR